jgi:hypothetical protein
VHRPELVLDRSEPKLPRMVLKHLDLCPKSRPKVIPLMLHGNAGMMVNSRLKGMTRMGGNRIPERHMLHCPVAKTNEHMSSQTCMFCFQVMRLARAHRRVGGKTKCIRLHGTVECINPECISFRCGYSHRARDTNAAVNIAIAGHSLLTSPNRQTLPPFSATTQRPSWSHTIPNASSFATGEEQTSTSTRSDAWTN